MADSPGTVAGFVRQGGRKIPCRWQDANGICTLNDIDISVRLRHYALWFLLVTALTLCCFFALLSLFGRYYDEKKFSLKDEIGLFEELFPAFLVLAGYYLLNSANVTALLFILSALLLLVLLIFLKLIWFHRLNFTVFRFFLILTLPAALFAYPFLMWRFPLVSRKDAVLLLLAAAAFYFLLQGLIKRLFLRRMEDDRYAVLLILTGIPLFATGLVQSFSLELRNIMEKRGLPYAPDAYKNYMAIVLAAILCSAAVFVFLSKNLSRISAIKAESVIQKIYYPLILLTVGFVIFQPAANVAPWQEYFETANHGLALDALFRYGSLPVIQSFDAHLLSKELPGMIYYALNGYEPWAYLLYNNLYYIPFVLLCYHFLKNIITPRQSLFFVLFLPFLFQIFDTNYIFSILLFFFTFRLLSRRKTRDDFYFWLMAACLLLYRLDVGVSALVGGLAAIVFGCLIYKIEFNVKKFLFSGLITGAFFGLIYLVLCLAKGVNPVGRFFEILSLCNSNQSWAYNNQGNPANIGYTLYYYLFPLCIIGLAIVLIVRLRGDETARKNSERYAVAGFLFFAGFYLSNLPRGIVRHSLAEETSVLILSTFAIAVLCYLFSGPSRLKFVKIIFACFLLMIGSNLAFRDIKVRVSGQISSVDMAAQKYRTLEPYSAKDIGKSRVAGAAVSGEAAELKTVLDSTLSPDETYLDFSSLDYYYALTGRKNPLYVNQSPLMISGDSGQKDALNEMKNSKTVYVLMPKGGLAWTNIDQVPVCLKYYRLSEYIYSRYEPFLSLQNADLWCLKTRSGSLKAAMERSKPTTAEKSVDLSRVDLSKLTATRCSVKKTQEGIEITPNGSDPNVSDFIAAIKTMPEFSAEPVNSLGFTVTTAADQRIQLYYTSGGDSDYTEKSSVVYPETAGSSRSFVFRPGTAISRLRFDMDAPVTITKITVNAGGGLYRNTYDDSNSRSLGYIPMEWGENDPSHSYEETGVLLSYAGNTSVPAGGQAQFSFNGKTFSQQPVYLSFAIDSKTDGIATLEYGTESKGQFSRTDSINFSTKAGCHRYMIRVSAYYDWWSNPINSVVFSDTADAVIQEASVKRGD